MPGHIASPQDEHPGSLAFPMLRLASCLRLSDFTLQTTGFKEGLARFVQVTRIIEWRKDRHGQGRGKSGPIIEKQEAYPAVLRKASQQGEGEASGLWGQGQQCDG